MRFPTIPAAMAVMAMAPGLLAAQEDLRVGGGIAVQATPAVGVPGYEVTPIAQAMLSYGLFEQVDIGAVVGFAPASTGAQSSSLTFHSIQLEPRFTPFQDSRFKPFVGGRVGYVRTAASLPVEGRKMAAGGFALGAIGGAGFQSSEAIRIELGVTVTSIYYGENAVDSYRGKGTALGMFLGTSIRIGR